MRRFPIFVAITALLSFTAAPASALNWSLGMNLGYQNLDIDGTEDNVNVFAWPNGSLLEAGGFAPGLRIGFVGDSPVHEIYLDNALTIFSTGDFSLRSFANTVNYQWNMPTETANNFFVTGGLGLAFLSASNGSDVSSTSPIFGGGVGVRHRMNHGHGALRAEIRFDRYVEGTDGGFVVVPETNAISIKLGFDLWN